MDPSVDRHESIGTPDGYTVIELMVVLALIGVVAAIAYPQVSDSLRKLRARDGAKAVVNAVVNARSQAMIRNVAFLVTLASSQSTGAQTPGAGGTITVQRSSGPSCTAFGTVMTLVEQYSYAPLGDVNLCLLRTTSSPEVNLSTPCAETTVHLCVTADGTITNLDDPAAAQTIAYVREYDGSGNAVGVVRQVVIPRRKTVQVNPIQVTNDACL
jgi:prepilin-type N-terminal cleavage/methylation domain-containing protein